MAKRTRTNLKNRAGAVAAEQTLGANTADKIGGLDQDIIDSVPMEWEPGRPYLDGELAIWNGRIVKAFGNTLAGDTPESAAAKWIDNVVDTLEKLGPGGPNLPVLASALKAYVAQQIAGGNGEGGEVPDKATEEMINAMTDNSAYITPFLIGKIVTKLIEASTKDIEQYEIGRGFVGTDFTEFGAIEFTSSDFLS